MRVKLLTRDGGFVREGNTPPFHPPPEAMIWGTRIFMRRGEYEPGTEPVDYYEGMAWSMDVEELIVGGHIVGGHMGPPLPPVRPAAPPHR
jgi:hypothetical protein